MSADDFGGDVVGGAPDFAGLGAFAFEAGEAEVGHFGVAGFVVEDVGGFDVAVGHAGGVGGLQAANDLLRGLQHEDFVERFVFFVQVVEASAVHQFHHDVGLAVFFAVVVDLNDVGAVNRGEGAGFLEELLRGASGRWIAA